MKNYADSNFVELEGDNMTGTLNMTGTSNITMEDRSNICFNIDCTTNMSYNGTALIING